MELSLRSSSLAVAALILFFESNTFWSLFRQTKLLDVTAIKPISDDLFEKDVFL
jgi:hypothetical protein